ncbi:MAG: hypothetical protein ACOC41_05500 [Chitinivibrionales bacterium]
MKTICACICTLLTIVCTAAADTEPFSPGFGMATQSTVLWENSPAARQPWSASALHGNEDVPFGFAAGAVSYYSDLQTLTDIVQATAGIWFTRKSITVKLAYSQLDALGQYYRQKAFLSAGIPLYFVADVRISMECELFRCGLSGTDETEAFATVGWTAMVRRKIANISLAFSHFVVESASDESFEPPLTMSCRVSTVRHRYGAQGIGFDYIMEHRTRFRFRLGHGFWIHEAFGATFSMATNPVTIGLGVELQFPSIETGAAYMFHPVLGWSRGIHLMYPWKKTNKEAGHLK